MPEPCKIIVVHGTCGSPERNWFPWLAKALAAQGHDVVVPAFPTPEGQSFEAWRALFRQQLSKPEGQTLLIGHSIGAPFVLRMAEETETPFKALFAIAPFAGFLGNEEFDTLNASFVDHAFDWSRIKAGAKERTCFAGDNDPYVPLSMAEDVAQNIDAPLHIVPGGGHLNAEFGYTAFPMLLDAIEKGSCRLTFAKNQSTLPEG